MHLKQIAKILVHFFSEDGLKEYAMRRMVREFQARTPDVFFVQIGSNDGKANDPLYRFIRKFHWHGVLIEPVPRLFARLRETYRDVPTVSFENVAIANATGTRTFYSLAESHDCGVPAWYDQLGSFNKEVIEKHRHLIPNFDARFQSEEIDCLSFTDLLEKYHVTRLDLLHMDTEGYDFELIKCIPFDRLRPAIIWFEHKHLSEDDAQACAALLTREGYRWIQTSSDTFAYQSFVSS